ncbi:MAG: hypothetical protein HOP29_18780 [Phycisphaerales bacterium]|nr:hypothetical protein [Phycisphaerales bacterium]
MWAALFVAHAAWLLRLVVIDASWSRQALLLLATLFLAWMTWNHRAGWIRRDRRSIVVCSVIVAMLHVNVVRRAIDIPADALPWTVPTLAGAAVCFLLHRIRRGHRHDRYTSTAIRTRSASTCPWDRVPDRIVSLAHQCAAALVTAPRAPPF